MTLTASARVDSRGLDVEVRVPAGRTLALIGPNGSGKSSFLAALAGWMVPDEGRAELAGQTLFDLGPGRRGQVTAPHRRGISMLSQESLLFPRMDVLDNVAFAPRARGVGRAASRAAGRTWLERVGSLELERRRPRQLSGGQAQRVALARALAAEPGLLLLDEPLSALDIGAAASMRHVLRTLLADRTTILVTHDVLDVVLLADEVVVLEQGRVVESGAAGSVMARPTSAFAAGFFGWNLVRGSVAGSGLLAVPGREPMRGHAVAELASGREAVAAFRPSAVSVHLQPPEGSPRNTFAGMVTGLEPLGELVRVRIGDLAADVTPDSVAELGLGPGVEVHLAVKAAEVSLYPV